MSSSFQEAILENGLTASKIGIPLSFKEGFLILLFAGAAGLYLRYAFKRFGNSFSSRSGYGNTIMLVTISVAALIAVVKSSLALSLGLVGALSVVRFRTAVKEPYNLTFILWAVCVGISIGASHVAFALLVVIFGTIAIILAYKVDGEIPNSRRKELSLDSLHITTDTNVEIDDLYRILDDFCNSYTIKTITSDEDDSMNILLGVSVKDHRSLSLMISKLKSDGKAKEINFYNSPSA